MKREYWPRWMKCQRKILDFPNDIEYGEMALLVDKEKVKFNLHQSIQLTDEEKMTCMQIESSLLPFEEQAC